MLVTKRLPKWFLPLLVFAAALAVRLAVIVLWNFDGLYGQDAFAYYDRSVDIANRLAHGWAPLPPFFWPNGYPILGALAILVVGEGPIGPQMVNVLMGSALAVLMFFFGRDLCRSCDEDAGADSSVDSGVMCGLIAGGCTVLAGQVVLSSVAVMSDITAAFWLTLAAWSIWRLVREPERWGWLPLAAAAASAAVVTRRASLLAGPAVAAVTVMVLGRIRRPVLAAALALAAVLIVAAPQLLVLESSDGVGSYFTDWHLLNAFARSFVVESGTHSYRFANGLFYLAPFWHPVLMPPTLGVFAIFGLGVMWRRQRAALFLLAGWYASAYLFMVAFPLQNLRFCLTLWPPAVLLVALGIVEGWRRRRRTTAALIAVSLIVALACNLWWLNRFMVRTQKTRTIAEKVATYLPDGGRVLAFDITGAVDHYTGAEVFELYNLDQQALARISDGARPTLLVVNRGEIMRRWMDHPPGANLSWLERERTLDVVEEIGPWSISRVGQGAAVGEDAR